MAKLESIEGIGETYAEKLRSIGVKTIEALLEKGATPKGRAELAAQTGISEKLVLDWVNRADLFRIPGIGEEYSDLLEAAGVDTVVELAQRRPEVLHARLGDANAARKLVRQLPTLDQVRSWVEHAKSLPRVIQY